MDTVRKKEAQGGIRQDGHEVQHRLERVTFSKSSSAPAHAESVESLREESFRPPHQSSCSSAMRLFGEEEEKEDVEEEEEEEEEDVEEDEEEEEEEEEEKRDSVEHSLDV